MTIAQVSEKTGLSSDTLRYYERVGLIPPVSRTPGGIRDYGESDIGWIEFIKCMRAAGLPIDMLIKYVELVGEGEKTASTRKAMLVEQRNLLAKRIAELSATLERLDRKIDRYERCLVPAEERLRSITSSDTK